MTEHYPNAIFFLKINNELDITQKKKNNLESYDQ